MRISLFEQYGAKNSVPVFDALRQGLENIGITCTSHDMTADVAVIWSVLWAGRMAKNQAVWEAFRQTGRPVMVAEVGMLKRGETWKLGVNGTGFNNYCYQYLDPARAERMGLTAQPWKNHGSNIVIAMQRSASFQWQGQPEPSIWLDQTVASIRQHSDRPIVVRPHPRQQLKTSKDYIIDRPIALANTYDSYDYNKALSNAWAVVNYNSGPGSQAVIAGVPAFVGDSSLARPVANLDLAQIENPVRPDRTGWLNCMAHTEWTASEIASGYPIKRLLNRLQTS